MENVVGIIKALQGDVHGAYVRDMYSQTQSNRASTIDVRINENWFPVLTNVLGVLYTVLVKELSADGVSLVVRRNAENNETESNEMTLNVSWFVRWAQVPKAYIDVNTLASNCSAIFVRPDSFLNVTNKIDDVMLRVQQRKFALIALPPHPPANVFDVLHATQELVSKGWTMDDLYLKKGSWVINKWSAFKDDAATVRGGFTPQERDTLLQRDQCSFCHETFGDEDIVLNTSCNHNFHWRCNTAEPGQDEVGMMGVASWFHLKRDFKCPVCRQRAINFVF